MDETRDKSRNAVESAILYAQSQLSGIIEKGKISNPERLGRLTPQIRNKRNKPERLAIDDATLALSSVIRDGLSSI